MKKYLLFLVASILFIPMCVFAKTEVGTPTELSDAVLDPTITRIELNADITVTEEFNIVLDDLDKIIDLNGHTLYFKNGSYKTVDFGDTDTTLTFTNSKNTGRIISEGSFLNIHNPSNTNSTIHFYDIDYENNKDGSGLFYNVATESPINLIIENVLFNYKRNAPLSDGQNIEIRSLIVLGKDQTDPVGFYNDGNKKYVKDLISNDMDLFLNGELDEHDRDTTWARDIYFLESNENGSVVIRPNDKVFVNVDLNGGSTNNPTRFLQDKNLELEINEETAMLEMTAPNGKTLDAVLVNGERKELGETIVFDEDTVIQYLWKDIHKMKFKDVNPDDWFYEVVKKAYDWGIIKGYNDTTFGSNDKVTRGQLVTILWRMESEPDATSLSNPFKDVGEDYFTSAIKWASSNDIIHGYNATKFRPNDPITRQDLAVILNNYAKFKGVSYEGNADLSTFADYDKVKGNYSEPALKWAVENKVMSGQNINSKKYISPTNNATRAETAAMIINYIEKFNA